MSRPQNRIFRAPEPLSDEEHAELAEMEAELAAARPRKREDCRHGLRPCPFVSCPHNTYLEVDWRGRIKPTWPDDVSPADVPSDCSCVLDVVEAGGTTLEEVGRRLGGITRERVRQVQVGALDKLRLWWSDDLRGLLATGEVIRGIRPEGEGEDEGEGEAQRYDGHGRCAVPGCPAYAWRSSPLCRAHSEALMGRGEGEGEGEGEGGTLGRETA